MLFRSGRLHVSGSHNTTASQASSCFLGFLFMAYNRASVRECMGGPTEPVCSLRVCGTCSLLDFSSALVAATRHKRGISLVLRRCTSRVVCVLLPFIRLFRCCGTTSSASLGVASRRSCHHAIWSSRLKKENRLPTIHGISIHFSRRSIWAGRSPGFRSVVRVP